MALLHTVAEVSSRQVVAATASALWRVVCGADCASSAPEAGRHVQAKLDALEPVLLAQELWATANGGSPHSALGLVN